MVNEKTRKLCDHIIYMNGHDEADHKNMAQEWSFKEQIVEMMGGEFRYTAYDMRPTIQPAESERIQLLGQTMITINCCRFPENQPV